MNFLSNLVTNKRAWQLLAVSAFVFELCALYFQVVLDLQPCIMCVYQRVGVFSILFAGLFGAFGCQFVLIRLLSYGFWGTGAIWGFFIAKEHVAMQSETFSLFFSCDVVPNFPSFAPLHEWIPFLFKATGDCGKVNWHFLGLSMPEWMMWVFGAYSVVFIIVFITRLIKHKMF